MIDPNQLLAVVRLLGPEEMTPTATRMLTKLAEESMSPPEEFTYARSLLGEEVEVVLEKGSPEGTDATVASGTLVAVEDTGQVVIRDEMGFAHYCWPMLTIRKVQP